MWQLEEALGNIDKGANKRIKETYFRLNKTGKTIFRRKRITHKTSLGMCF